MKDYYQVLGVSAHASQEEIKQRFRFLAHAYHPDKFATATQKAQAEEAIKKINEANGILSNPAKRAQYDVKRSSSDSSYEKDQRRKAAARAAQRRAAAERRRTEEERRKREEPEAVRYWVQEEQRRREQPEAEQRRTEEERLPRFITDIRDGETVEIVDLHPEDSYYHERQRLIGSLIMVKNPLHRGSGWNCTHAYFHSRQDYELRQGVADGVLFSHVRLKRVTGH